MKREQNLPGDAAELRRRAEERRQTRERTPQSTPDTQRLVHELEVHQIELEMQNAELQQARARAEALLAQYTELYDFAPAGYFTLAHDSKIRQANLTGASLLGIERSRLLKQRFAGFVAAEASSAFGDLLARAFESKTPQSGVVTLSVEGQPRLNVLLQASVTGDDQECRVVMTDLTEHERAEAGLRQLAAIVESSDDAIISKDLDGTILTWNAGARHIFGYRAEEVIGQNIALLIPEDRRSEQAGIMEKVRKGEPVEHYEALRRRRDGTLLPVSLTISPLRDAAGNIVGASKIVRDITERKRVEEEVLKNRAKLESALASMTDAVFISDAQGRFIEFNEAFATFHRFKSKDQCAKHLAEYPGFLEVFLPNGEPAPLEQWAVPRALRGETATNAEYTLRRKDTGETWVGSYTFAPIRDKDGLIVGSVVTGRDITKRKRTEEALQKQNRFIQTILDHAPIGFAVNTINDGAFQYVNARFEEIYGVPRDALRSVENFFDLVYADPLYREELRARIMADVASGDPTRMCWEDVAFTTRTGESKVVTAVNIPLPDQNLMVSTVMDVTHRKRAEAALRESEERLRFALQRSHTGGWDLDLVDHTAHRTLEHDRIFGYQTLLPQWTYEMFLERVLPEDRGEVDRRFREAIAAQTDWGFECRIRRADAAVRWIWAAGGHQRDGQGKARRMAGIVQDITERKQAEEKVRLLNAELEQRVIERTAKLRAANEELEAFSYSVSHDLRAPLRHVHGFVEMLAQEAGTQLSEKGWRYLKTITDASKEMGELIDDLLAFSRMGRVEMCETSVDLDTLVRKTLRDLEIATSSRNIVWKIPLLPVVQGDPAMLKQVFANLLGNAVKYTRPRDPAQIELGCAGEEDGRIILFVRDNGVGFDPQYAHKLFGVFQRLHRADQFEGTGVGLANVRRIIARHGGRTWAEGKVNEGATFYFTLKPISARAK
jgi:PAS domain S-box-containing protein